MTNIVMFVDVRHLSRLF